MKNRLWLEKLEIHIGQELRETAEDYVNYHYQPLAPTITEKENRTFFDKLIFLVDTTNYTELDEILTNEVGQRYKTLDRGIPSDF